MERADQAAVTIDGLSFPTIEIGLRGRIRRRHRGRESPDRSSQDAFRDGGAEPVESRLARSEVTLS